MLDFFSAGRRHVDLSLVALVAVGVNGSSAQAATVGQPAPDFALKDLNGKTVQLADFRGKTVVLEWHNPGCPFVQKHYDSANMPNLQRKLANDVVWLAINSTHVGHTDHRDAAGYASYMKEKAPSEFRICSTPMAKPARPTAQ